MNKNQAIKKKKKATAPTWEKVLKEIFPSAEARKKLQLLVGKIIISRP